MLTAEALPWISKAGIEKGAVGIGKETALNLMLDASLGWIGKGVRAGVEQVMPMTTRVSKEALEAWATPKGKKLIQKYAGEGENLSDYVIENLDNLRNLIKLELSNNKIQKIGGLENLGKLQELFLDRNNIKILEGINTLEKLIILFLESNEISEFNNKSILKLIKEVISVYRTGRSW